MNYLNDNLLAMGQFAHAMATIFGFISILVVPSLVIAEIMVYGFSRKVIYHALIGIAVAVLCGAVFLVTPPMPERDTTAREEAR